MAKAVLSVLLTADGWTRYGDLFQDQFWQSSTTRRLFGVVQDFWSVAGEDVAELDDETLDSLLRSAHPKRAAECLQYVRDAKQVPEGVRGPLIARALQDFAVRNELFELVQDLESGNFNPASAAVRMDRLALAASNGSGPPLPAHLAIFEDIQVEEECTHYPTGIPDIDRQLGGGLWSGELGVAMAPAKRGKTWFLVHQGAHALRSGIPVQHHTFKTEVNARRARIRYYQNLCKAERPQILEHTKRYSRKLKRMKLPLWELVEHDGNPTTGDIRQCVQKFIRSCEGCELRPLIVVDYLGLVSPVDRSLEGRWAYLARAQELRHIASSFDVALWTAHQTNRASFDKYRIHMQDAAEAIGVTWAADVILTLNQTEDEKRIGVMRWNIESARERDFVVSEWDVNAVKKYQRFEPQLTTAQQKEQYS